MSQIQYEPWESDAIMRPLYLDGARVTHCKWEGAAYVRRAAEDLSRPIDPELSYNDRMTVEARDQEDKEREMLSYPFRRQSSRRTHHRAGELVICHADSGKCFRFFPEFRPEIFLYGWSVIPREFPQPEPLIVPFPK